MARLESSKGVGALGTPFASYSGRATRHTRDVDEMLTFLQKLLRFVPPLAPRRRPEVRIVLLTRAGCHLCDDALAVLQETREAYGFQMETIDVDSSPELAAEHGDFVPVVLVDGKVRFRGRVNAVLLRRLLDAT
ncbi:MAG: glutaredoxin family protein [Planctomycetes bacterium]|nr:glutaredoxin family protein [Planctomycetota bacterium]